VYATLAFALLAVGTLASYVPARRAMHIAPIDALRPN
jgi:ABC-type lipoprotein release transport system permease subunit